MNVVKRDGRKEPIMFDKITDRIRKLNYELNSVLTTSLKQKQEAHVPYLNIPKTYLKFCNKYIFDVMNCCKLLTFIIEKFQCGINSFEYVFLRVLS